ncbi:ras-like gtp-binding protein rhol [Anaeramoeba flamelloides]|uniref:Ras-like gtp-binding protein rhol n=1 Tax=Anaeramoeba flamelloides TaxID=1746091 RepID=A0ABQ8X970_9EUKA|nr:ras-like gtp-binding protein rhol [Anaeramoeba flamelloides]
MKIHVIGDEGVGKRCLILTYLTGEFPNSYVPRVVENKIIKKHYKNEQFYLHVWNSSGQEDYDSLRALSYNGTDIFYLCYNPRSRESFENIQYRWLPEVEVISPKSAFLIVSLKNDNRSIDDELPIAVSQKEGRELAKKFGSIGFFECSSFLKENISEVFEFGISYYFTKMVRKKKIMKRLFSKFQIKNLMVNSKSNKFYEYLPQPQIKKPQKKIFEKLNKLIIIDSIMDLERINNLKRDKQEELEEKEKEENDEKEKEKKKENKDQELTKNKKQQRLNNNYKNYYCLFFWEQTVNKNSILTHSIAIHPLILTSKSKIFQMLLSEENTTKLESTLKLKKIHDRTYLVKPYLFENFLQILKFFISGEIENLRNLKKNDHLQLYELAKNFQIRSLCNLLNQFVKKPKPFEIVEGGRLIRDTAKREKKEIIKSLKREFIQQKFSNFNLFCWKKNLNNFLWDNKYHKKKKYDNKKNNGNMNTKNNKSNKNNMNNKNNKSNKNNMKKTKIKNNKNHRNNKNNKNNRNGQNAKNVKRVKRIKTFKTQKKSRNDSMGLKRNNTVNDINTRQDNIFQKIISNKEILIARSKYFKKMLRNPFEETSKNLIIIMGFDPNLLKDYLQFLYTNKVNIKNVQHNSDLLLLADYFGQRDLVKYCVYYLSKFLIHQMSIGQTIYLYNISNLLNLIDIKMICLWKMGNNFKIFNKSKKFNKAFSKQEKISIQNFHYFKTLKTKSKNDPDSFSLVQKIDNINQSFL